MSAHENADPTVNTESAESAESAVNAVIARRVAEEERLSLMSKLIYNGAHRSLLELEAHCAFSGLVASYESEDDVYALLSWCEAQLEERPDEERSFVTELAFEIAMHCGVQPAMRRAAVSHLGPTLQLMFAAELLPPCCEELCTGERDALGDDVVAQLVIDALTEPREADEGLIALVCRLRPNVLRMLDALVDVEHPEQWQRHLAMTVSSLMTPGVALAQLAWEQARLFAETFSRPLVRLASNPYHPYGESAALEYEQRFGEGGLAHHIPPSELRDTLDLELERFFGLTDEDGQVADVPVPLSDALRLHLMWASGLAEQLVEGGGLDEAGRDLVSLNLALRLDVDGSARHSIAAIGDSAAFVPGSALLGLSFFQSAAAAHLPELESIPRQSLPMLVAPSRYDDTDLRPLLSVLCHPYAVLAAMLPAPVLGDLVATMTDRCGIYLDAGWETLDRLVEAAPDVPFLQLLELTGTYLYQERLHRD